MKNLLLFGSLTVLSFSFSCAKTEASPDEASRAAEACTAGSCAPPPAPTKPSSADERGTGGGAPSPRVEGERLKDVGAAVRVPIEMLPTFGNPRALVTLVAFTDYECPYCAKADERIETLRREYGDRMRLVVGSHPLPFHERATPAAAAFLAAVEQGKGEPMHSRLFAKPGALDEEGLLAAATDVGLDLGAFDRARKGAASAALARAKVIGDQLGVTGTPTFFVNGRRIVGAQPIETFRAIIEEELVKAKALTDRGIAASQVYETLNAVAPVYVAPKSENVDDVRDVSIGDAPTRGPARAPLTVVLFSDFECPFCVRAEKTVRELETARAGEVRVAFKHRPLPMHPHARLAAKASIAAERQGKFWEYHDVLVAHRDALAREDLDRYAGEVGLDLRRFARDLEDAAVEARIVADEKLATDLDVKGTPTAFVNGQRVSGAQPLATWQSVAAASLRRVNRIAP